jgi:hypothetical protein
MPIDDVKDFVLRLNDWLKAQPEIQSSEVDDPDGLTICALLPEYDVLVEIRRLGDYS